VTPLSALYVAVYYSLGFAAAMVVGTAWACANLFLLKHLVGAWIRPGKRAKKSAAILVSVKIPVLYVLGYLALRYDALPVLGLLAGFWIPKGVIVLKFLGMMLSKRLSGRPTPVRGAGGARRMKSGGAVAFFVFLALALWLVPQLGGEGADAHAVSETAVIEQQGHGSSGHGDAQDHGAQEDSHGDQAGHGEKDEGGEAAGHGQQDEHGEETGHGAAAGHAEEGHGEEHGEGGGHTELPNFITLIVGFLGKDTPVGHFLHTWENFIFSFLSVIIIGLIVSAASRRATLVPGPLQNVIEFLVESLDGFICGILGPQGRKHVPFLGSLFIYILFMNLAGLVPFMRSPTANLNQTLALALCVFCYVQYTGIRNLGVKGYVSHLAGSPKDPISYALIPIMLPLHIIGELAKPMSLSLRLFGNITGEDVLIVIFVTLGIGMLAFMNLPIGIPLQLPFYFLAILTSTIQALVFMLLSTVYFLMMMPHDEH
jgi:F-type H+-transporting ATPase subunit a